MLPPRTWLHRAVATAAAAVIARVVARAVSAANQQTTIIIGAAFVAPFLAPDRDVIHC